MTENQQKNCEQALQEFYTQKKLQWNDSFQEDSVPVLEAAIGQFRTQFEGAWKAFLETNYQPKEDEKDGLIAAMRYVLSGKGKRVRSLLVLLAFDAFYTEAKDTPAYAEAFGKACRVGIGMEMIHAYSLVHDDLPCMDDDAMRRGQPSAHVEFGEAIAVLTGDGLLTDGVKVLLASGIPNTAAAVHFVLDSMGSQGMVLGQSLDMQYERKRAEFDPAKAEEVHLLKTGRLFSACLVAGYVAAGKADPEAVQALAALGLDWGLIFQMEDDLLDLADGSKLGKEGGGDLSAGKQSFCRQPEKAVEKLGPACERITACIEGLGLKNTELSYYLTGTVYRKSQVH